MWNLQGENPKSLGGGCRASSSVKPAMATAKTPRMSRPMKINTSFKNAQTNKLGVIGGVGRTLKNPVGHTLLRKN